jgi:hypothetical protein
VRLLDKPAHPLGILSTIIKRDGISTTLLYINGRRPPRIRGRDIELFLLSNITTRGFIPS